MQYWTVTDEGIEAFIEARKEAAREIQTLTQQQKAEPDREMKKWYSEQIKAQKRIEKAANILLERFNKVGKNKPFPPELDQEIRTIFWKAENAR